MEMETLLRSKVKRRIVVGPAFIKCDARKCSCNFLCLSNKKEEKYVTKLNLCKRSKSLKKEANEFCGWQSVAWLGNCGENAIACVTLCTQRSPLWKLNPYTLNQQIVFSVWYVTQMLHNKTALIIILVKELAY